MAVKSTARSQKKLPGYLQPTIKSRLSGKHGNLHVITSHSGERAARIEQATQSAKSAYSSTPSRRTVRAPLSATVISRRSGTLSSSSRTASSLFSRSTPGSARSRASISPRTGDSFIATPKYKRTRPPQAAAPQSPNAQTEEAPSPSPAPANPQIIVARSKRSLAAAGRRAAAHLQKASSLPRGRTGYSTPLPVQGPSSPVPKPEEKKVSNASPRPPAASAAKPAKQKNGPPTRKVSRASPRSPAEPAKGKKDPSTTPREEEKKVSSASPRTPAEPAKEKKAPSTTPREEEKKVLDVSSQPPVEPAKGSDTQDLLRKAASGSLLARLKPLQPVPNVASPIPSLNGEQSAASAALVSVTTDHSTASKVDASSDPEPPAPVVSSEPDSFAVAPPEINGAPDSPIHPSLTPVVEPSLSPEEEAIQRDTEALRWMMRVNSVPKRHELNCEKLMEMVKHYLRVEFQRDRDSASSALKTILSNMGKKASEPPKPEDIELIRNREFPDQELGHAYSLIDAIPIYLLYKLPIQGQGYTDLLLLYGSVSSMLFLSFIHLLGSNLNTIVLVGCTKLQGTAWINFGMCAQLKKLVIWGCPGLNNPDELAKALATCPSSLFEHISIVEQAVSGRLISALSSLSSLKHLGLPFCTFSSSTSFSPLRSLKTLALDLSGPRAISDGQTKEVSELLSTTSMRITQDSLSPSCYIATLLAPPPVLPPKRKRKQPDEPTITFRNIVKQAVEARRKIQKNPEDGSEKIVYDPPVRRIFSKLVPQGLDPASYYQMELERLGIVPKDTGLFGQDTFDLYDGELWLQEATNLALLAKRLYGHYRLEHEDPKATLFILAALDSLRERFERLNLFGSPQTPQDQLTRIPDSFRHLKFPYVQIMDLSNNSLTEAPQFTQMLGLTCLNLSGNPISEIHKSSVEFYWALRELYLDNTQLEKIPEELILFFCRQERKEPLYLFLRNVPILSCPSNLPIFNKIYITSNLNQPPPTTFKVIVVTNNLPLLEAYTTFLGS